MSSKLDHDTRFYLQLLFEDLLEAPDLETMIELVGTLALNQHTLPLPN